MWTRLLTTLSFVLFVGTSPLAQQPPPGGGASSATQSGQKPAESVPDTRPPDKAPEPEGQPVNMRLELTITDQIGSGAPMKRSVSLIVADRQTGFIRTSGRTRTGQSGRLDVDARPYILPNGKVRLWLGLAYQPVVADAMEISVLNQQFTVILETGKLFPMTEAADPLSDRKTTVDARVTIMK